MKNKLFVVLSAALILFAACDEDTGSEEGKGGDTPIQPEGGYIINPTDINSRLLGKWVSADGEEEFVISVSHVLHFLLPEEAEFLCGEYLRERKEGKYGLFYVDSGGPEYMELDYELKGNNVLSLGGGDIVYMRVGDGTGLQGTWVYEDELYSVTITFEDGFLNYDVKSKYVTHYNAGHYRKYAYELVGEHKIGFEWINLFLHSHIAGREYEMPFVFYSLNDNNTTLILSPYSHRMGDITNEMIKTYNDDPLTSPKYEHDMFATELDSLYHDVEGLAIPLAEYFGEVYTRVD
jgi:hypothetical protein